MCTALLTFNPCDAGEPDRTDCPHWLLALTIPFSRSNRAHTGSAGVGAGVPRGSAPDGTRPAEKLLRLSEGRSGRSNGLVTLADPSGCRQRETKDAAPVHAQLQRAGQGPLMSVHGGPVNEGSWSRPDRRTVRRAAPTPTKQMPHDLCPVPAVAGPLHPRVACGGPTAPRMPPRCSKLNGLSAPPAAKQGSGACAAC